MHSKLIIAVSTAALLGAGLFYLVIHRDSDDTPKAGLRALYEKVQVGMSRPDVEAILGAPEFPPLEQPSGETWVNYLGDSYRERDPLPHESPYSFTGMRVTYLDGKVVEKELNHQWLKK